jgi:hypothetical protein
MPEVMCTARGAPSAYAICHLLAHVCPSFVSYRPGSLPLNGTMLDKNSFGVVVVTAAALAGGCVDSLASGTGDEALDPAAGLEAAPITGTAFDTYGTAQGDQQVPRDLTGVIIEALVPAADGSFVAHAGQGTSAGTFEIPGVPVGPYYLNFEGRYLVTSARTLDFGRRVVGRSTQHAVSAATLALAVDNMPAWQDGDILELYAPNAGAAFSSVELVADVPPAAGDTALDLSVDYLGAELPMAIDASAGDEAFLTHSRTSVTAQGMPYQALGAIAHLQPFSLPDGGAATAHGSFEAVAQDRAPTVDWRTTEYRRLISGAVPGGASTFANTFLGYVDLDARARYSLPLLFILYPPTDADLATTISYGNPFPADWKEYVRISMFGFHQHIIDGRSGSSFAGAGITAATGEVFSGAIRPAIEPVRNLRVDGRDGAGDLTGVSGHALITWDSPGLGTADSYQVQVIRLVPSGTRLARQTVARIYTTDKSVRIPGDALAPGQPHFILVRAQAHPTVSLERLPFVSAYPFTWADRITTVFKP